MAKERSKGKSIPFICVTLVLRRRGDEVSKGRVMGRRQKLRLEWCLLAMGHGSVSQVNSRS